MSKIIYLDNLGTAYLAGAAAPVSIKNSREMFATPETTPQPVTIKKTEYRGVVPWGTNNNLPNELITKVYGNPVMSSGLEFNIKIAYGEGVQVGRYEMQNGERVFVPVYDNQEVNRFFEENDINSYILEQLTDLSVFYNVFPEIILNREKKPKIVSLTSKEASFSRWETMNPETGEIENHFYSSKWGESSIPDEADIDVTPVLSRRNTLTDLRVRMGIEKDSSGSLRPADNYRFIVPVHFPTPGRSYYQKPYYYSIIESGWYDLSAAIPDFKNAILTNQMAIKYHVELADDYFEKIFAKEGITSDSDKKARIKLEFDNLNDFLAGAKNAGKAAISYIKYSPDGKELRRMKITPIEGKKEGGEYLEDSEEASNVISFGLGVHPSLIGSAPGKNSTISGTEARELFIIKQALQRPIRDRILRPLYLIKQFNEWDPTLEFEIANMTLTRLDQNTGSQKVIS